jgi:hypothetical protein
MRGEAKVYCSLSSLSCCAASVGSLRHPILKQDFCISKPAKSNASGGVVFHALSYTMSLLIHSLSVFSFANLYILLRFNFFFCVALLYLLKLLRWFFGTCLCGVPVYYPAFNRRFLVSSYFLVLPPVALGHIGSLLTYRS